MCDLRASLTSDGPLTRRGRLCTPTSQSFYALRRMWNAVATRAAPRGPPRATRTHVVVCTPDRVGVVVVVVAAALARGASGTSESLRVALARRVTAVVDIREGGLLAALCSHVSDRQANAVAAPPR